MEKDINITSVVVKADVCELRCDWTPQMVVDISSYQGIKWEEYIKPISRINSINKIFKTEKNDN